jgi:hypothetical protein
MPTFIVAREFRGRTLYLKDHNPVGNTFHWTADKTEAKTFGPQVPSRIMDDAQGYHADAYAIDSDGCVIRRGSTTHHMANYRDMLNPRGDPRGPMRKVVAVGVTVETNHHVTFECGHQTEMAQHFWYKVGSEMHCFQCGPLARK